MIYILYNPKANTNHGEEAAESAKHEINGESELIRLIGFDLKSFIPTLTKDDNVILCGGDGTLNRFVNEADELPCPLYLYKAGNGNDFLRDIDESGNKSLIRVNDYIRSLPTVTINGETRRFINGIGYGIDGMVCDVADDMKANGAEKINYAGLSIKLLLSGYKCPNASVTVDGVTKNYKKVWLASSMNGRFYGGGMMVAPDQNRSAGKLSLVVLYGTGKLRTLMIFPGIFKGTHLRHKKATDLLCGREITVEFDKPTPLQIDGEVVKNVTKYSVKAPDTVKSIKEETISERI